MTDHPEKEPIVDDPAAGEVLEAAAEESAAAAGPDGATAASADALADTITAELAERTADLQRLTAEYANYRRRVERDRKATIDSAKAAVVAELLGVLDDLDRARAHGDLEAGPLKSVADKLADALQKQGLEEFGAEGEPFDPTLHEAVQHEGSGSEPVIGMVMRKGYRFGERVLRHALVGVTDGPANGAAAQADPTNAGADASNNG
ncbi:nucleotide exchange factor GrpE [Nocardia sp. CC227C]|uniref:nucleotide exchange factor GrpE n=1 Tax=Nocardia sp. CC227C TaxID=3044562 RepID=UPI00278C641F|nr:nucleotide exchange factor GrpE [Nocardia sp. CC227C]